MLKKKDMSSAWRARERGKPHDSYDQMHFSKSQAYLSAQQRTHCQPYCVTLSNQQCHCPRPPRTRESAPRWAATHPQHFLCLGRKARFSFQFSRKQKHFGTGSLLQYRTLTNEFRFPTVSVVWIRTEQDLGLSRQKGSLRRTWHVKRWSAFCPWEGQ